MSSFCTAHFFSKKFEHICVSLGVNFNESLTNDIVSFEQLGPGLYGNKSSLEAGASLGYSVSLVLPGHQLYHFALNHGRNTFLRIITQLWMEKDENRCHD